MTFKATTSALLVIAVTSLPACSGHRSGASSASSGPRAQIPEFEIIGPVQLPPGYNFTRKSPSWLNVTGMTSTDGRVLAVAAPILPPALYSQPEDEDGSGPQFSASRRVLVKKLDAGGPWALFDPIADLELGTRQYLWFPKEQHALLGFAFEADDETPWADDSYLGHRFLGSDLQLADVRPGVPLNWDELDRPGARWVGRRSGCGGKVEVDYSDGEVQLSVGGQRQSRSPAVRLIPDGTPYISHPSDTVQANVEVVAATCCGDEVFWVEIGQRANVSQATYDSNVNAPMAVSIQGLRMGLVGYDIFPDLVGEIDARVARTTVGCFGPYPVVAMLIDSIWHPAELWIALPPETKKVPAAPALPQQAPSAAVAACAPPSSGAATPAAVATETSDAPDEGVDAEADHDATSAPSDTLGCTSNLDCKGTRVCRDGDCMDAPSSSGCDSDLDCKGERVCVSRRCTSP